MKVFDTESEQFSIEFYTSLFKGEQVQNCFERTSCDKSRVRIYGDNLEEAVFQPVDRIDSTKSLHTHDLTMTSENLSHFSFLNKKKDLVNFLISFLKNKELNVINVIGAPRTGKSVYVKKSLAYLKERQAISSCMFVDFRQEGHEVANYI